MTWGNRIKALAEELHPRKFFTGWLRSAILALIFGLIAYLNEAGPLLIAVIMANIGLLTFAVLERATDRAAATVVAALLVIFGLGVLAWTVHKKHADDANYALHVDDYAVLRSGVTLPTGEGQVTGINAALDVGNKYSFPLYYKIERRYANINGQFTPLDNPGASIKMMDVNRAAEIDTPSIPVQLENGKYHTVQTEFEVLFGRTPKLEKRFRYTAKWEFFLCPRSGNICGPITTSDERITISSNDPAVEQ